MVNCYIGVGSNLGNRKKNIQEALKKIQALKNTHLVKSSKLIETAPCGGPAHQGKFLNAALKINTRLSPFELLKGLKRIEKELGRIKTIRYGPRAIDLDILFYADKTINTNRLRIPHPRVFEREFVIRPLLEVL